MKRSLHSNQKYVTNHVVNGKIRGETYAMRKLHEAGAANRTMKTFMTDVATSAAVSTALV